MNKQQIILTYLAIAKEATLEQICTSVPIYYYNNDRKYIGEILSRMVKSGKVERVRKGGFRARAEELNGNLFIEHK